LAKSNTIQSLPVMTLIEVIISKRQQKHFSRELRECTRISIIKLLNLSRRAVDYVFSRFALPSCPLLVEFAFALG
jgi:hypothetical protein